MTSKELVAWLKGYVAAHPGISVDAKGNILKRLEEFKLSETEEATKILQILRKWDGEGMPEGREYT